MAQIVSKYKKDRIFFERLSNACVTTPFFKYLVHLNQLKVGRTAMVHQHCYKHWDYSCLSED